MSRRAKIVCTLGPATTPEVVSRLVDSGMDVARLNLSHGDHNSHRQAYEAVRRASDNTGRAVGVLADLQGPKMRLGRVADGTVVLATGSTVTITMEDVLGDASRLPTTYPYLARDLSVGDVVLVDDGRVRLEVVGSDGEAEVRCLVIEGGPVSDNKGLNVPHRRLSAPAFTEKDRADLEFVLDLGVDLVAQSFVRDAGDVAGLRAALDGMGRSLPVIAKLEKPEAVAALDEVIAAYDGIMIARGDLGVELPLEQVPLEQKRAVRLARLHRKPVIVATQMLESMVDSTRPTRAEASDVANAVLDGTDAVMLSAETSIGRYPEQAVTTMARIVVAAETESLALMPALGGGSTTRGEAIAEAAVGIAMSLSARALVAFTTTGASARQLAAHRPAVPLMAFTPDPAVRCRLAVVWGMEAYVVPEVVTTDDMVAVVSGALVGQGLGESGDTVVMVFGTLAQPGSTNTIRVERLV